jgi:hypothetical protein
MPRMRLALSSALVLVLLQTGTTLAGYYSRPAFHGADHGAAVDCWDCHWFDAENAFNASHISPLVIGAEGAIYDISYTGSQDLVKPDRRGICQVCHTQTKYWGASYDWGSGAYPDFHFPEDNCLSCHPHWQPDDLFRPQMKGPKSHETHLSEPKGPRLPECTSCHYFGDYSRFADGETINFTTVCDACHSPDGPVDGMDDPEIGARANWLYGVYDGGQLKPGKEHWCDGCHDSGASVVNGVQAPNVLGDNYSYGYNATGHGRNPENYVGCLDCHAATYEHCDGDPRTYKSTYSGSNYVPGYRLGQDLSSPRAWYRDGMATDYALCLSCHDSVGLFSAGGIMKTNFRNDRSTVFPSKNLHLLHLINAPFSHGPFWDSDWAGSSAPDSPASCPACHNVHGSPTPGMTRHGELMGLGSLGLDFKWLAQDGISPAATLEASRWGASELDYNLNRICIGCHGIYSDRYFRVPYQVLVPLPGEPAPQPLYNGLVWTSDLANNPKTKFRPGNACRIHCVYYVCPFNPPPPYNVIRKLRIGPWDITRKSEVPGQAEGAYTCYWDVKVPGTAALGATTVKVSIKSTIFGVTHRELLKATVKVVP